MPSEALNHLLLTAKTSCLLCHQKKHKAVPLCLALKKPQKRINSILTIICAISLEQHLSLTRQSLIGLNHYFRKTLLTGVKLEYINCKPEPPIRRFYFFARHYILRLRFYHEKRLQTKFLTFEQTLFTVLYAFLATVFTTGTTFFNP